MRLRTLQRCLGQDLQDLIDLASRILKRSKASLLVDELSSRDIRRVFEVLLSYPKGYPIPYIVREVPFYGRTFYVDERVLVPRSETEGLIDVVLSLGIRPKSIIDVGTGSGVIGITLKLLFPESTVVLTDVSFDSIMVAKANARRHNVSVLTVVTDLLSGIRGEFDLIVSNPPYVAREELGKYDRRVLYEPEDALVGGETGFEITARLLEQAADRLSPGGYLVVESDPQHFPRFPKGTRFVGRFAVVPSSLLKSDTGVYLHV